MTTDAPTETAPWPIPAGTLASENLSAYLESMAFEAATAEGEVLDLIDKRPESDDPLRDVWNHDLAVVIDRLETIIDKAKEVQHAAAVAFCRALPFPAPSSITYADTRPLVPRFPKNRTAWDNAALAMAVRSEIITGVLDGIEDPEAEEVAASVAARTAGAFEAVITLSGNNAKTTGIRALGLDPDEFCTSEKRDPEVQVVK